MQEHVLEYWPRMALSWLVRSVLPLVSWLLPRLVSLAYVLSECLQQAAGSSPVSAQAPGGERTAP